MNLIIHRGTKEIGGNCVEIQYESKRLILDLGLPFDTEGSETLLPKYLRKPDDSVLAVVISHAHLDHYGLIKYLPSNTPILIGKASKRILETAAPFLRSNVTFNKTIDLEDHKPIQIGPFEITPYLVDHSAYDAYSILISAGNKKIFYSGDFRGHGRKAYLFENLLSNPPRDVDILLMEGTALGRNDDAKIPTEDDLVPKFVKEMKSTKGLCLIYSSGQNIDRLVGLIKACNQAGRLLVIDFYTAEILGATENPRLPQGTWNGIKVYLPKSQKELVKRNKLYERIDKYKNNRIYRKNIANDASQYAMIFRPSMRKELEESRCLNNAALIYSMWSGYLRREESKPFLEWADRNNINIKIIHTSGHATLNDLERLERAIDPKQLIPIHTLRRDLYSEHFNNVKLVNDGEVLEV